MSVISSELTHSDPPTPLKRQGCFIRNGMCFVNMIGDKYQGRSYELMTILMPNIECQAYFSSPGLLHLQAF